MPYNLGVVGIGHWFFRLHEGMVKTNDIQLLKIAGASDAEKHRTQLEKLNVPEFNYYQIKPGEQIWDDFFSDVDIVQIADPCEFHASQMLQSLKKNKIVVVEKTLELIVRSLRMSPTTSLQTIYRLRHMCIFITRTSCLQCSFQNY